MSDFLLKEDGDKLLLESGDGTLLESSPVTLYFVGDIDSDWNDTGNWASSSGGAGGAGVPSSIDDVIFDANSPDCNIDVNAVCKTINSTGYTATLTQNNTFTLTVSGTVTWAAGTFVGGDSLIDINDGSLMQSGGTFTNSSGGMNIERNLNVSGGTFNNSGIITFDSSGSADNTTITFPGVLPGTVDIQSTAGSASFTVAPGTTINLGADPTTITNTSTFVNNGTIIIASGTWTHTGNNQRLQNNGTITHLGDGWIFTDAGLLNNVGATITYAGTAMSMENNFTDDGTFDSTGITLTFLGTGVSDDTVFRQASQVFEGNIVINKTNASARFTIGTDVTIQGSFTRTDGILDNPASPFTLTVEGDFLLENDDAFGGANLTLKFAGENNQSITQNASTITGPVVVDKSGNIATLATAISTGGTFNVTGGVFDVDGNNLTSTGAFVVAAGGTLRLRGDETFTTASTTLSSGSTVVYHTAAVTAVIDNLSTAFSNITGGASKTHNFTASTTFIISGTFASNGTSSTRSILRSTVPATTWLLNFTGTSTLADKVDVQDSDASPGNEVSAIGSVGEVQNNTNWSFAAAGGGNPIGMSRFQRHPNPRLAILPSMGLR